MTTIPPDHPLWKLAQSLIALAGLYLLATHGVSLAEGLHSGPDLGDAAGIGGAALAGKLIYQVLKG